MRKSWFVALACVGSQATWAMVIPPAIEGRSLNDSASVRVGTHGATQDTVVVFLSARCPCSMSHESTLAALAREFGKEVRFVGVHSNSDESSEEAAAHFRQAALPFPVIQDEGSRLADQLGALKTPHVFVIGKNGELLFQGGVDDSHDAARASRLYLKAALQSLRAGKTPEITQARSLGCLIKR